MSSSFEDTPWSHSIPLLCLPRCLPVAGTLALLGVLLSLLTAAALPASADDPAAQTDESAATTAGEGDEPFTEEIYVTARKRKEDVQKIPISITTFNDTALEERSITELNEIAAFTPNLEFNVSGGFADQTSEATVFIRGVGQIDTAVFSDPAVGIYVDGVYLARAQGSVLDLLDVERVEVLRGPQGTLFGKNTTGGALSLVTRKPGNAFGGRVEATAGDLDRIDGRLTLDVPLASDRLLSRLSLLSTQRDGFSSSLTTGQRYHDDDRQAARLGLRWLPSDSVTVDLTAERTRQRQTGGNQLLLAIDQTPIIQFYNAALTGAGRTPYDARWISPDLYHTYSTGDPFLDGDVGGVTANLSWVASPSLQLQSISAWRTVEFTSYSEGDSSPLALADRRGATEQEQWSQELQLTGTGWGDRLTWVVGGLYFEERPHEESTQRLLADLYDALEALPGPILAPPGVPDVLCNPGPPPPGVPCFGGAGNPANFGFFVGDGTVQMLDLKTRSWALFGEGTFTLGDRLSATVGVRYSQDHKEFDYLSRPALAPASSLTNEDDWDAVTPRLSLAYQARPDILLYLSAARGFKSGGFNGRPQQRPVLDPYDPETVWSYEAGWKSEWLGRRLTLNGALFYSDYDDIQFAASFDVNGQPVFVTQNAGSARISGFELEAAAQPLSGVTLNAGVGYLDNEFTDVDPRVPGDLTEGGVLPKTPEWSWNASAQYAWEAGRLGSVIARADYGYRTEVFNDIQNSPTLIQDAFGLLNARLLVAPSDHWELSLFGTNLTDEAYLETGFFTGAFGPSIAIAGRPREWGVTARYFF